MRRIFLCAAGLALFLLNIHSFSASAFSDLTIIKISSRDQTAIVKSDNKLRLIKPGDLIGASGRVLEIGETRIVVEEGTAQGKELIIIYFENGKQRIEHIKKFTETIPPLYVPREQVEQE